MRRGGLKPLGPLPLDRGLGSLSLQSLPYDCGKTPTDTHRKRIPFTRTRDRWYPVSLILTQGTWTVTGTYFLSRRPR